MGNYWRGVIHEEDTCGPARDIRGNSPSTLAARPAAHTALLGIPWLVLLAVRLELRTAHMALLTMRRLVFPAVQLELPAGHTALLGFRRRLFRPASRPVLAGGRPVAAVGGNGPGLPGGSSRTSAARPWSWRSSRSCS